MDNKAIVITLYGTGNAINDFTVTLFDNNSSGWRPASNGSDYCSNINELELKDDNWIYAFAVKENEKIKVENPRKNDFDIISTLDDRSIQKVIREVGHHELEKALKSAKKETRKAILRNMSKRSAKMIINNMRYMGFIGRPEVSLMDIKEAQRRIGKIIQNMKDTGQITFQKSSPGDV
jgi:flagellar motor switch protein FliG